MDLRPTPNDGTLRPETGPVTGIPQAWVPRMPKDSTDAGYGESWKMLVSSFVKLLPPSLLSLATIVVEEITRQAP
jgi:hypothetical protein